MQNHAGKESRVWKETAERQGGDKWSQVGDKCEVTRAKAPKHPERIGRQVEGRWRKVGDTCEMTRAKNPKYINYQITRSAEDNREKSVKSCGQRIQSRVWWETRGPSVIMRTRALKASRVYWGTSVSKWETAENPEYWETVGRQLGKGEVKHRQMQNHAKRGTVTTQTVLADKLKTSVKSCGQNPV